MHNNNIKAIENVASLNKLSHIFLQWNNITEIKGLENLPNLKKLYLGHNEIRCLENLESLPRLEELYIEGQKLNGETFKFNIDCLRVISVSLILSLLQSQN